MPDMAEKYGVDTSNTFAALEDDVEKGDKDGKTEKKDAPRNKVAKKDKEKHGKSSKSAPAVPEQTRAKKHEGFDRRQGPGPQQKNKTKGSGGGKWDKDGGAQQQALEDVQIAQDQEDTELPNQEAPDAKDGKDGKDVKDAKDKKDEKSYLDLDEYRKALEKKRPEGDTLKPRAPRTDGDFREVKEFKKEEVGNLKYDPPKPEQKQEKKAPAPQKNQNQGKGKAKGKEVKKEVSAPAKKETPSSSSSLSGSILLKGSSSRRTRILSTES